jgi:hypothetical protein
MLSAAHVAGETALPLVFAFTLKLLLQLLFRILERLDVPRALAALLLIVALFGTIVGLGAAISGPASHWATKIPEGIPRLEERLSFLRAAISAVHQFLQQTENIGATGARQDEPGPLGGATNLGPSPGFVIFLLAGLLTTDTLRHGVSPRTALPGNSYDRGRDGNAVVSGETVHSQSRSRHSVARLLVLDVGYFRRDPLRAHAGHRQNSLRPASTACRAWSISRRVSPKPMSRRRATIWAFALMRRAALIEDSARGFASRRRLRRA